MSARADERIQPALHALLLGDADGLRAALEVDPEAVNLTVGGNTLLELTTQPDVSPPSSEIVDLTYRSDAAGWAQACVDGSEAATAIRELIDTASS